MPTKWVFLAVGANLFSFPESLIPDQSPTPQ